MSPARLVPNSIECCKKGGIWEEFGTPPTVTDQPGKRSDLEDFKAAVKSGQRNRVELREQFSKVHANYPRFFDAYIMDNIPKPKIETHSLRKWQQDLNVQLKRPPDRRKMFFVVDYKGNTGKTWFSQYYCSLHDNATIMEPGKKADMTYALPDEIRVLFVDCTREQCEHLQYSFLESCKNGRVFSSKYESRIKLYNPMDIVVLMNHDPDMTKLSEDRHEIVHL